MVNKIGMLVIAVVFAAIFFQGEGKPEDAIETASDPHAGHNHGEDPHAGHDHSKDPHAGHDHAKDPHAGHDHGTSKRAKAVALTEEQKKILLDKDHAFHKRKAPASYKAIFNTTKGTFVVSVERELSPIGADHFYNLVDSGYFNGVRFFRVMKGFIAQFGIHGDPALSKVWATNNIKDDKANTLSNTRGTLSYAKPGRPSDKDNRSNHIFINYANNANLDGQNFVPFGTVVKGMEAVDKLNGEYSAGRRAGPDQTSAELGGNVYFDEFFPKLDYIIEAKIKKDKESK